MNPFSGMYAAARFVDERALVVNAEDFRFRLKRLELPGDVVRDAFHAAAGVVGTGRYRCGDERRCAVARQRFCHGGHGLRGAFHYVVATGTVNVNVDKPGNCGLAGGGDFRRAGRHGHVLARADSFNHAVANQDSGIGYFGSGSQCARDMQQNGGHRQVNIVAEITRTTKRNGREKSPARQK